MDRAVSGRRYILVCKAAYKTSHDDLPAGAIYNVVLATDDFFTEALLEVFDVYVAVASYEPDPEPSAFPWLRLAPEQLQRGVVLEALDAEATKALV